MEHTARNAALEALLCVTENEGYSNIVLDKTLREYQLEKRDSALASHIFYGVLEKKLTIDFYIKSLLKHPDFTINPVILEILRIAAYQAIYLDKIPENAIVNEAVNCVKECKKEQSAGFVNGVLRELIRHKDKILLPDTNTAFGLSINYSVPEELIRIWINTYGLDNAINILKSFLEKSRHYVRVNNTKTTVDEFIKAVQAEPCAGLEFACEFTEGGNVAELKEFQDGFFHVQDLSSQYLCKIVNPQENEVIIDTCAAPGGKTFTIAETMNGTGKVYAYDIYKGRVKLIRTGAYRLGLTNIMASIRNATDEKCELSNADKILCDVPCSGFGTIRRKPEIRYKALSSISELPEIQYNILNKSALHLKKGGTLIYSTCTLRHEENGAIADRFLCEHDDFEAVAIKIPKGLKRTINEPSNQLTMMPFAGETDGFFVAEFIKKM